MKWFEFLKEARESIDFEKYLDEHWDEVDPSENIWFHISCEKLSEPFITAHSDKVVWRNISKYSPLSESFMETHQNEIDWKAISANQILSKEFCKKFATKVDWTECLSRNQFPQDFLLELIEDPNVSIDIGNIIQNQRLSEEELRRLKKIYNDLEIERIQNRVRNHFQK